MKEKSPYRPPRIRRPKLVKNKRQLDYKPNEEKRQQIERIAILFAGYKGSIRARLKIFFKYLGYEDQIAYERGRDYTRKGIRPNIKYSIIADLYEENLILKEKLNNSKKTLDNE